MKNLFIVFLLCGSFPTVFLRLYHLNKSPLEVEYQSERGDTLILTPLIKQGKIEQARKLSKVDFKEFGDVESYSGYLTVDELFNSNLFFWFFPSKTNYKNAPVILWLQGGPGASSIFGLLMENGPLELIDTNEIKFRNYSWTENHSIIYIDNPVGTGFSFTNGGYALNQTIIGKSLYTALLQFFQLFPELQKNEFFVSGESYAGKYIPAVSYAIHKNNPQAQQKINLQGFAIGNGLTDPRHQMIGYADFLYQIGLVDFNERIDMQETENATISAIENQKFSEAQRLWVENLDLITQFSGFTNFYNFLISDDILGGEDKRLTRYLRRNSVKKALHTGNVNFHGINWNVYSNLEADITQSVVDWVSELLSHYRVLIYNGQLDIIVPYPSTVNYLHNLKFSAAENYKTADRYQWYVDSELAGYVKVAGNLTEVLVRNAGHMVPSDQPAWAFDLISKFTRNEPLH